MSELSLFNQSLFFGSVYQVTSSEVRATYNLNNNKNGIMYHGERYGCGEIGEFVVIEVGIYAVLGRITKSELEAKEKFLTQISNSDMQPMSTIQLLGNYEILNEKLSTGTKITPRIGDKIYIAPIEFLDKLTSLFENDKNSIKFDFGTFSKGVKGKFQISPEQLFTRHCAILGATGGGKSYTVAKLIEEIEKNNGNYLLIDATGEYSQEYKTILGNNLFLEYSDFTEDDLVSFFSASIGVQRPKMLEAIKSLKIVAYNKNNINNDLKLNNYIVNDLFIKLNNSKNNFNQFLNDKVSSEVLYTNKYKFDINKLSQQIINECIYEEALINNAKSPHNWGGRNETESNYCSSLISRINHRINHAEVRKIFDNSQNPSALKLKDITKIKSLSLELVTYQFNLRPIVANCIARQLLANARKGDYKDKPLIVIVDEAHNFLNQSIGEGDTNYRLDAFEILAKEGRKYGLHLVLATQRPSDIPDGVLSQMGTLIIHRLTNDRDREKVERACGDIDKSVIGFLPNLASGEAIVAGTGFPFPISVKVNEPKNPPIIKSKKFSKAWETPINKV